MRFNAVRLYCDVRCGCVFSDIVVQSDCFGARFMRLCCLVMISCAELSAVGLLRIAVCLGPYSIGVGLHLHACLCVPLIRVDRAGYGL